MERLRGWLKNTQQHILMEEESDRAEREKAAPTTWRVYWNRAPYYIPILGWLPKYDMKEDFSFDLVAGLAVAAMLVPQSLAYAILAGLPPIIGLYTAWLPLIVYAILGTSRQMSVGPDALASILVGVNLGGSHIAGNGTAPGIIPSLSPSETAHVWALLGGVFLLALGFFRLGFLDNMLARPLLCGLINAVAFVIVLEQTDTLFGLNAAPRHAWDKLAWVWQHKQQVHWPTFGTGVFGIVFLFFLKWVTWYFPGVRWMRYVSSILLLVVLSTFVCFLAGLDQRWKLQILGEISSTFPAFPTPILPKFTSLQVIQNSLPPSMLVCVIGFIECMIAAKRYAHKNDYQVYPNRELVAIGLANLLGSFFQTYPTCTLSLLLRSKFGSLPRSSVADAMGARTQMFALVASTVILVTILFAGPMFHFLPKVVMAAVIIVAAVGMVELEDIHFYWSLRAWQEMLLVTITFLFTIILGVELGILLMIITSVFILVKYTSVPLTYAVDLSILGRIASDGRYKDVSSFPSASIDPNVIVLRVEESLYFANVEQIKALLVRIEHTGSLDSHPGDTLPIPPPLYFGAIFVSGIVIHAGGIPEIDASALQALKEMVNGYKARAVTMCYVKVRERVKRRLIRAKVIESDDSESLFGSIEDAVAYVRRKRTLSEFIAEKRTELSVQVVPPPDPEREPSTTALLAPVLEEHVKEELPVRKADEEEAIRKAPSPTGGRHDDEDRDDGIEMQRVPL